MSWDDPVSCATATPPANDVVCRKGWTARLGLLSVLVLLTLLPRVAMSHLRPVLCTDAVFFLERAAAFERGQFDAGLARIGLNPYPLLLALLHTPHVDWESAGRLWSLALAALAAIPLFALTGRLFGTAPAVIASLLYAVQPELIEWSPEIIRDPTFWFLLLATLYVSYEAACAQRHQLALYALAGTLIALAGMTRFEGWFLVVPLAWWAVAYGRLASAWRACGVRLGVALSMTPVWLVLINATLLTGHERWEWGRFDPLILALRWTGDVVEAPPLQEIGVPAVATASSRDAVAVEDAAKRPSIKAMCWGMTHTLVQSAHPLYLLAISAGLWSARRRNFLCDQAPLWTLAAINLVAVWIYFWNHHEINARYMLLLVLVGLPYAGLGVQQSSQLLARVVRDKFRQRRLAFAAMATMLAVFAVIGCSDALNSGYQSRFLKADLGRWIRVRFGAQRTVLCSENLERLVGYYARARHASISPDASPSEALARIDELEPDLLVLWLPQASEQLLLEHFLQNDGAEFEIYGREALPPNCRDVAVLARRPLTARPKTDETGPQGVSLSDPARPLY